ncbi:hypothetical protein [Novosphingobium sp. BL-52-GroH]|uniref:hypothetical protein n=1 Tax=Novosphingobium sp. BL-52-GroH TaxID=3349877 RepID=UPI00384DAEEA
MKGKSNFGWQTSLADLSLILFMLSATALQRQPPAKPAPPAVVHESPRSEPLAVYEAGPGAPSLGAWLAQQAGDPRQQLTITARYGEAPGAREAALREAARLLGEAGTAGRSARLVVEPGAGPARVALAYDTPDQVARDLL